MFFKPQKLWECIDGVWHDLGPSSICNLTESCTNPPGTHGTFAPCGEGFGGQPYTTHSYQCNDGVWDNLGDSCITAAPCPDCSQPPCENYGNATDCTDADCYWYDGACHKDPPIPPPPLPDWVVPVAIAGAVATGIIAVAYIAKKK